MADEYALLGDYAEAVKEFRQADETYQAALQSIQPAQEARDTTYARVEAVVEAMGGADPFQIIKQARAASAARRGSRGPRDPSRRNAVVEAIAEPRTLAEVVDATGLDRNYVSNALTNLAKSGKVQTAGERGSRTYQYVGTTETPTEVPAEPEPVPA